MVTRRGLLGLAGIGAATSLVSSTVGGQDITGARRSMKGYRAPKLDEIRVGIIGIGNRGYTAVQRLTRIPHVKLIAVCDLVAERTERVALELKERNYNTDTKQFNQGSTAYRRLNDLDLDVVYICTPWNEHSPMAIDAMKKGKHALVEVPICTTLEEGQALIQAAERYNRHCMMLENVCYGRTEMAVRNMINADVLGTVVHAEGAYLHYIANEMFDDRTKVPFRWRLNQKALHNGNLYPTHGIGPVSKYLDITQTDEFVELVSMSSRQAGLTEYALTQYGRDSKEYQRTYVGGDMNLTLIRTRKGRTVLLQYDTTNPRPYSRLNVVTGTKGVFMGFPDRLYLHDQKKPGRGEVFDPELTEEYITRYAPAVWKNRQVDATGHADMDWLMDEVWVENLRNGLPMDISVYESVLWSIITPLSQQSISRGHSPVRCPTL